jgi:outer membrane protein
MFNHLKKYKVIILISTLLTGISQNVFAENLLEVYQDALANDSTFKQAQADWLAARQNLPVAESYLMPNLTITAGGAYNFPNYTQDAAFATNEPYASSSVSLILTQPIFNVSVWYSLREAKAGVKAATANFFFAQQDLIVRTVRAYLNVLQAYDFLRFTRANKVAFAESYDTAKQKYDVGLVPITDVLDAQARYDQAQARELANINQLADSQEVLKEITGHYYEILDGLGDKGIPLTSPSPNDIEAWAETSAKQNYQLQAQHFNAEVSKANIGVQSSNYFPSVGFQGSFSDLRQYNRDLTFDHGEEKTLVQQLTTLGLGVSYNFFSGGSTVAQTQQARYQYASASAKEQTVYQQVVGATRQAFLGVNSYSAQVRADELSIKSASSALESVRSAYRVGTRTLLDVLNDTTQLYQSQQSYAIDQYAYINNYVALKEYAGILSGVDISTLNAWLTKPIDLEAAKKLSKDSETKEKRQSTDTPKNLGNTNPAASVNSAGKAQAQMPQ